MFTYWDKIFNKIATGSKDSDIKSFFKKLG